MIRFIGGKPGGGKSFLAVLRLVEELRTSNRFIVTNLAIEMHPWIDGGRKPRAGLVEALRQKYNDDFDCQRRLVFLEDEQVKRFYAYRPRFKDNGEVELVVLPAIRQGPMEGRFLFAPGKAEGQEGLNGCWYGIDEAHEYFASREWAKTGKEVLSWASQHRRAGDDVYFLTQQIGNVEKQLRGVSQECFWLTNHRLASIGMFRQPDMLSYKLYSSTPPGASEVPMVRTRVKCDREFIYSIYNTSKGVGVAGRQADIGTRARGLHWSWVLVFLVCIWGVFVYFNKGVQWGIRKAVGFGPSSVSNGLAGAAVAASSVVTNAIVAKPVISSAPSVAPAPSPASVPPPPWVVAAATGERACLLLSDGSYVTGTNWTEVYHGWAVDGRFYGSVPTGASNVFATRSGPVVPVKEPRIWMKGNAPRL